jgi:hypothetical protein
VTRRAKASVRENRREIAVYAEVDVVVCGGGPAGVAAALAAARMRKHVLLVERYGFLGGMATAAGVNGLGGWHYDTDGRPLIQGIPMEIMQRLAANGGADQKWVQRLNDPEVSREGLPYIFYGIGCYWIHTHPEYMKLTLDDMMAEAGVHLLYHSLAVSPVMDRRTVRGVIVENKSGRKAILAGAVIDCTGDGDIAARAGAEYDQGRPDDGAFQPMSLIFTIGNAEVKKFYESIEKGNNPLATNRYEGALRLARERGEFAINPNDLICSTIPLSPDRPVANVNFTRVQKLDATDADDLTRAEILGRKQVFEAIAVMRRYMTGLEDCYLIALPAQIGLRESRRIRGEYVLTGDDIQRGARFPDGIGRGIYLIDIHNPNEVGMPSTLVELDKPYDIPYRCLVPQHVENLLVAGRCISGDHVALSSYREQSHCMVMGEAAGTAAALAVERGQRLGSIDTNALRTRLEMNGANIGPPV